MSSIWRHLYLLFALDNFFNTSHRTLPRPTPLPQTAIKYAMEPLKHTENYFQLCLNVVYDFL